MLRKLFIVIFLWVFPIYVRQREIHFNHNKHVKLSFQGQNLTFLAGLVSLLVSHGYWKRVFYIFLTTLLLTLDGLLFYILIDCVRQKGQNGYIILGSLRETDTSSANFHLEHFFKSKRCDLEKGRSVVDSRSIDSRSAYDALIHINCNRYLSRPINNKYKKLIDSGISSKDLFDHQDDIRCSIEKRRPWYFELNRSTSQQNDTIVYPLEGYFNEVLQNNSTSSLMRYEWARFASFKKFPVESPMSALRLAQNGFYFKGVGDKAACFSCNLEYDNWKIGDSPSIIHKQLKPECGFLTGKDTSNVPIHENTGPISEPTNQTIDASTTVTETIVSDGALGASANTTYQREARRTLEEYQGATAAPIATSKDINKHTITDRTDSIQVREQCDFTAEHKDPEVTCRKPPRHPDYEDVNKRRDTFKDWPIEHIIPAQVLILAGFVYAGTADCVRCFHCSIGLRNWEKEDDPWTEHARWSQNCDYLRENKGTAFIQKYATQIDGVRDEPKSNKSATWSVDAKSQKKQTITAPTCPPKQSREQKSSRSNSPSERVKSASPKKDSAIVKEENYKLRSQITCKICMDRETNTVCLPCGHLVTCHVCTTNLRKCAICRTRIQARVKVFIS